MTTCNLPSLEKFRFSPYLYIASFLTAVNLYIFYIRYRIRGFHPQIDLSPFIYTQSYEVRPEIDLQLYLIGWAFVIVAGMIIFFFFKKFLDQLSITKQEIGTRIYLKTMIVLNILYVLGIKIISRGIEFDFFIYLVIFAVLFIICFYIPHRFSKIFFFIDIVYNSLAIFLTFGLTSFLLYRFLSFKSLSSDLIWFFINNSYVNFNGLFWWQLLSVLLIISGALFLFLTSPKILILTSSNTVVKLVLDILALIGIIWFVSIIVNWRDGYNYGASPYFDYSSIVGSINDVLGGKTLLVNIPSQYGLLMIYALSAVFAVFPLSYNYFFLVNYITTILGYSTVYFIMRKWLKSIALPYFGIFLISQHHYFSQIINILFYGQLTFLRFGMWIPLLYFLLIKDKLKLKSKVKSLIELLLVGVASFWGFDVGLHVLGAYLVYITVKGLLNYGLTRKGLINICFSYFRTGTILIFLFSLLTLFTYFRSGVLPNWIYFTGSVFQFASGWGLAPLPAQGPYLFFLAVYLGCFIYISYNVLFLSPSSLTSEKESDLPIVAFVNGYGILLFIYYIGRSTDNNLHSVVLPLILLIVWILKQFKIFFATYKIRSFHLKLQITGFVALILTTFSILTTVGLVNTYNSYLKRSGISSQTDEIALSNDIVKSISFLNEYLQGKDKRKIALISENDTFLLMKTKSVNAIDSNAIYYFNLYSQLEDLGKQLLLNNLSLVFVDHTIDYYWNARVVYLKERYIDKNYHFKENIGYLDVYERN